LKAEKLRGEKREHERKKVKGNGTTRKQERENGRNIEGYIERKEARRYSVIMKQKRKTVDQCYFITLVKEIEMWQCINQSNFPDPVKSPVAEVWLIVGLTALSQLISME